jgi:D-alanyl-D-alanine carboxypeptidase
MTLDLAQRSMLLTSANDLEMALAETVGGSDEAFIERMRATATRLGMSRTHFKNPHGLPDHEQLSTARDMAILARAIHRDFPNHAHFLPLASSTLASDR